MSEHLTGMQSSKHKNASSTAKRIRDVLQEYFVTDGKVTWQETHKDDFWADFYITGYTRWTVEQLI